MLVLSIVEGEVLPKGMSDLSYITSLSVIRQMGVLPSGASVTDGDTHLSYHRHTSKLQRVRGGSSRRRMMGGKPTFEIRCH